LKRKATKFGSSFGLKQQLTGDIPPSPPPRRVIV